MPTYDAQTTLRYLRNSDVYGFYLRLKKHAYKITYSLILNGYHVFVFDNDDTICSIYVKRHSTSLRVFNKDRPLTVLKTALFHLEPHLLKYLGDVKPLQLRRIINPETVNRLKLHSRKGVKRHDKKA